MLKPAIGETSTTQCGVWAGLSQATAPPAQLDAWPVLACHHTHDILK